MVGEGRIRQSLGFSSFHQNTLWPQPHSPAGWCTGIIAQHISVHCLEVSVMIFSCTPSMWRHGGWQGVCGALGFMGMAKIG